MNTPNFLNIARAVLDEYNEFGEQDTIADALREAHTDGATIEREKCAKVADDIAHRYVAHPEDDDSDYDDGATTAADEIAAAIRERGR